MKNNFSQGGGNSSYSAPTVEILDIAIERGFAASNDVTAPQWGQGNDWYNR